MQIDSKNALAKLADAMRGVANADDHNLDFKQREDGVIELSWWTQDDDEASEDPNTAELVMYRGVRSNQGKYVVLIRFPKTEETAWVTPTPNYVWAVLNA